MRLHYADNCDRAIVRAGWLMLLVTVLADSRMPSPDRTHRDDDTSRRAGRSYLAGTVPLSSTAENVGRFLSLVARLTTQCARVAV